MDAQSADNLTPIVDNVVQYHMNRSHEIVPDERDFLRPWRRRIRDILASNDEDMLEFLECPSEEWAGMSRHTTFLKDLETMPVGAEWFRIHVNPIVDKDAVLATVDEAIGAPLTELRKSVHHCLELYQELVPKLFACDERLRVNLEKLEALKKQVLDITELDTNESEETKNLQTALISYIEKCYGSWGIRADYEQFCTLFTEFCAYRSVIPGLHETGRLNPLCTICTTERITLTLIPCGHMFCNSCGQKQRSCCYICRSTVQGRQRVYFS